MPNITKKERERITRQENALMTLGFTSHECAALRRASMILQRWHELECGDERGHVERDETTNRCYFVSGNTGKRYRTPDRETGAHKRIAAIVDNCNKARRTHENAGKLAPLEPLAFYIQTDPRGAALYILRPGDVPTGYRADACYTNGVCVY